mmetsp:Transcript_40213/g.65017  ORF Transcript_40213/g.65017 Transcript_40213/m.65017 type:complete len:652 (+) Transcript_40213:117-2072(+)
MSPSTDTTPVIAEAHKQPAQGQNSSKAGEMASDPADTDCGRCGRKTLYTVFPEDMMTTEGVTVTYLTKEILSGVTIGFAQIPESVAFAFLGHVKPPIALHAAWMVGLICSLFGGRPGMVNGATGASAAIIATFLPVPEEKGGNGEGVELLFPTVMFAGLLMFFVSAANLSRFILLLPAPVMVGFCNGLAIVIGLAQLHPFQDSDHGYKSGAELWWMLLIMIVSMVTMEFLPKIPLKIFKVIPSSLIAILVAVLIEFAAVRPLGSKTDTIGDVSKFTSETAFPVPFFLPSQGYDLNNIMSWKSVRAIAVQGFLLCTVKTIESLMTSEVVESFVKTPSNGDRTVLAMGFGNVISGFFGGMGGNAMIGLSTINVLNGGRGRLAPCCAALVVMVAVMGAYPALNFIPVAALSGIMLVVVLHTFKWFSLGMLAAALLPKFLREKLNLHRKVPRVEALVVLLVTLLSVFANIAYAVVAGVAVCAISFSWDAGASLKVSQSMSGDIKVYSIDGPMFFASANRLIKIVDPDGDPEKVEIRFGESSLMDYTSVVTLHDLALAYRAVGKSLTFHTLNETSRKIIEKANHLVKAIEYTHVPLEVPDVPSLTDGFRADPLASLGQAKESANQTDMDESGQINQLDMSGAADLEQRPHLDQITL